jgi:hypothetical protein
VQIIIIIIIIIQVLLKYSVLLKKVFSVLEELEYPDYGAAGFFETVLRMYKTHGIKLQMTNISTY